MEWVDWYNNRRLFEAIGDITPTEAEANHYRTTAPSENLQMAELSLHKTQGGSLLWAWI
jgi:putative transposase